MNNPSETNEIASIRSLAGDLASSLRWAYWELASTPKVFESPEEASGWFGAMNRAHYLLELAEAEEASAFEAHLLAEEV